MILDSLLADDAAMREARDAMRLIEAMYPICRSITGNGVRRTLDLVGERVSLERSEVASGTPVYDWEVPREWNIRDAYVADAEGRRVVDFRAHNLHVVNYSTPVRARMTLDELQPHLHSLPEWPDRIPYRTSYWRENWGFCLRHRDRERLRPGVFDVVVDADLAPGHLSLGEAAIEGSGGGEALIYTHSCHPSLANDNLSGIAIAAALARALRREHPRLTWRFVFGPGTIGSLTWLSRNEHRLPMLRGGWTIGLLGDAGPLTYKRSRRGATVADRIAEAVLAGEAARLMDFEPYGYDERQFCSPGFDLPIGRLTRSPNGAYPEYHTSADDLSLIRVESLAQSLKAIARMIAMLDANRRPLNLQPKGEPRLGKRGLYGSVGGLEPREFEYALLWVLSQSDGHHDLVDIARRSGLPFATIERAAGELERVGLLADVPEGEHMMRGSGS